MKKIKKRATGKRAQIQTISKAKRKEYNAMMEEHIRLITQNNIKMGNLPLKFPHHICGHDHTPQDPKQAEIEEFRDIQTLYRSRPLSRMMAALDANDHVKASWEYAFIAGYKWAQNHPTSHTDPYLAFTVWAKGFAHRLVLCADVAFKQGIDEYVKRISLDQYVKPPKTKRSSKRA